MPVKLVFRHPTHIHSSFTIEQLSLVVAPSSPSSFKLTHLSSYAACLRQEGSEESASLSFMESDNLSTPIASLPLAWAVGDRQDTSPSTLALRVPFYDVSPDRSPLFSLHMNLSESTQLSLTQWKQRGVSIVADKQE